MIPVEPILHRAYGGYGVLNVLVAREHDEGRIFALALWRWGVGVSWIIICWSIRGAFRGEHKG